MGFEPMNTGFADRRVSHFAIGARTATYAMRVCGKVVDVPGYFPAAAVSAGASWVTSVGCAVVRRYGFSVR